MELLHRVLEKHEEFSMTPVEEFWRVQWCVMNPVKDLMERDQSSWMSGSTVLNYILCIEEL